MSNPDYFQIGFIKKPHGLKGDVNISIAQEMIPEEVSVFFLEVEGSLVPYFIETFSLNNDKATVKFEDVNSLEQAKLIGAKKVFLPTSERPKLSKGEFYDDEIIGFAVLEETVGPLGILEEIINAGGNRLFAVRKEGEEVLIPETGPFILEINKAKKTIFVSLPEGFLEMNE